MHFVFTIYQPVSKVGNNVKDTCILAESVLLMLKQSANAKLK